MYPGDTVTTDSIRSEAGRDRGTASTGVLAFIRQLLRLAGPARGQAALLVLLVLVTAAVASSFPVLVAIVLDEAITGEAGVASEVLLASVGGSLVVLWTTQSLLLAGLAARINHEIRTKLHRRLMLGPLDGWDQSAASEMNELLGKHLSGLEGFVQVEGPKVLYAGIMAAVSFVLIFAFSWPLAIVCLSIGISAPLLPTLASKRHRAEVESERLEQSQMNAWLQDAATQQRIIRVLGVQAFWLERLTELSTRLRDRNQQVGTWLLLGKSSVSSTGIVMKTVVFLGGALLVSWRWMSIGELMGFLAVLTNIENNMNRLSDSVPAALRAASSTSRLDEATRRAPGPEKLEVPRHALTFARQLHFNEVSFGYDDGPPVLEKVSIHVLPGTRTALVGPSGSGKSTVLGLLLGFMHPRSGDIRWDGEVMNDRTQIIQQLGYVPQDVRLFNLSIEDNIRMGKLEASREEVEAAARAAEVHDAIVAMPEAYATQVGEGGLKLSGGQRQRIGLARALVAKPPLLILDEATSSLDPQTEAAVNQTLDRLAERCAILAVTHRLNALREFEQILVLDSGRVVEQGTHDELEASGQLYARMLQKQNGYVLSEDGRSARVDPSWLATVPLLSGLDLESRRWLAAGMTLERFRADQRILEQGAPADAMYFITRGEVAVHHRQLEASRAEEIVRLLDGDFFGEIALIEGGTRRASVVAVQDCLLATLSKSTLMTLLEGREDLRLDLLSKAKERTEDLLSA